MKGIILAAGSGSRLCPLTRGVSKQLLPVYDKPLLYYPLSILLLAGIRDILAITSAPAAPAFRALLGAGEAFGARLAYAVQDRPRGIADAFRLGGGFIAGSACCLILGDNIFLDPAAPALDSAFARQLRAAAELKSGALIFALRVADARPFGVVELDDSGRVLSLTEKPEQPASNYIAPGLYFYDGQAAAWAKGLRPSARGELEITDLNRAYLERGQLRAQKLPPDLRWFDAGNAEALYQAATTVRGLQQASGRLLCCPEEIAYRRGFIGREGLATAGQAAAATAYGQYLLRLSREEESGAADI